MTRPEDTKMSETLGCRAKTRKRCSGTRKKTQKMCEDFHAEQSRIKPNIIYMETPEIIHTDVHHFMNLVQLLTGKNQDSDLKPNLSSSSSAFSNSTQSSLYAEGNKNSSAISQTQLLVVSMNEGSVTNESDDFYAFCHPQVVDSTDQFLSA